MEREETVADAELRRAEQSATRELAELWTDVLCTTDWYDSPRGYELEPIEGTAAAAALRLVCSALQRRGVPKDESIARLLGALEKEMEFMGEASPRRDEARKKTLDGMRKLLEKAVTQIEA
jgi:hypothetical protein